MGWAKFHEDVIKRYDNSTHYSGVTPVGPAGDESKLRASIEIKELIETFHNVLPDFIKLFESEKCVKLSIEMENINNSIFSLDECEILEYCDALSVELDCIYLKGDRIYHKMESLLSKLFKDLKTIQWRCPKEMLSNEPDIRMIIESAGLICNGHECFRRDLDVLRERKKIIKASILDECMEKYLDFYADIPNKDG